MTLFLRVAAAALCLLQAGCTVGSVTPPKVSVLEIAAPKGWRPLFDRELDYAVRAALIRHYAGIPKHPQITIFTSWGWHVEESRPNRMVLTSSLSYRYAKEFSFTPLFVAQTRGKYDLEALTLTVRFEPESDARSLKKAPAATHAKNLLVGTVATVAGMASLPTGRKFPARVENLEIEAPKEWRTMLSGPHKNSMVQAALTLHYGGERLGPKTVAVYPTDWTVVESKPDHAVLRGPLGLLYEDQMSFTPLLVAKPRREFKVPQQTLTIRVD
jgi:hypothetical protein